MSFDLGSFLGGILGGVLTLVGVFSTIIYYKKSDKEKLSLQIYSERPDLKIIDEENKNEPDLDMILIPIKGVRCSDDYWVKLDYDSQYSRPKSELEYIDYYFKNAGKTAISRVIFISGNQKKYSLFELYDESVRKQIIDGNPHFNVELDKRIDPGDVIKVRMYHGTTIYTHAFSAVMTVALFDTAERLYEQAFFYPNPKIYSSTHYEGGKEQYLKDIKLKYYLDYTIKELKTRKISNTE